LATSGGVLIFVEEVAEVRRRRVVCREEEEDDAPPFVSCQRRRGKWPGGLVLGCGAGPRLGRPWAAVACQVNFLSFSLFSIFYFEFVI
jgi:hypothetical protein